MHSGFVNIKYQDKTKQFRCSASSNIEDFKRLILSYFSIITEKLVGFKDKQGEKLWKES